MNDRNWCLETIPLKFTWQATNYELDYLKELVARQKKQRLPLMIEQHDVNHPSIIIDGFLYHGDIKHASNKTILEELNIRSIINISDCQLNQDIVEQRHVLWINVDDDTYADIAQHFETTNAFLQACKEKQKPVLVHCQMGVSRSSTIVLAYLMKHHLYSLDQAYHYLVQRRPIAEPNLAFLLQLLRYERSLKR